MACSENSPAGQDQDNIILSPDWQNKQRIGLQDQYQFSLPARPTEENMYLIIDPDGKTPANYQKFLSPLDQSDKNTKD